MSAEVEVDNFGDGLDELTPRIMEAYRHGLDVAGEFVMGESMEIVPVSPADKTHPQYIGTSGFLRDSATTYPAMVEGTQVEKVIGYGASYAIFVHERLDVDHQYEGAYNPRAQAKFLEQPVLANGEKVNAFCEAEVRKVIVQ